MHIYILHIYIQIRICALETDLHIYGYLTYDKGSGVVRSGWTSQYGMTGMLSIILGENDIGTLSMQ